jgi:hypothetical protein
VRNLGHLAQELVTLMTFELVQLRGARLRDEERVAAQVLRRVQYDVPGRQADDCVRVLALFGRLNAGTGVTRHRGSIARA